MAHTIIHPYVLLCFVFLEVDFTAPSPVSSMPSNELAKPNEFSKSATGWINTVPLSNSSATLSKRSAKSVKRIPVADNFVKCYLKKRNLILELLVRIQILCK